MKAHSSTAAASIFTYAAVLAVLTVALFLAFTVYEAIAPLASALVDVRATLDAGK